VTADGCDGARSTLKSPSTSVGDYQTNDLDRLAASLNGLAASRCKPSADEASDHIAIEPMHERKLVLRHPMQNAVKQRQCMALLLAEDWFLWRHPHTWRTN
jgi:hypothetical protein